MAVPEQTFATGGNKMWCTWLAHGVKGLLPGKIRRKLWRRDLGRFVREHGFSSGLELGAKSGLSMEAVLKENPELRLTGIDLWEDMPDSSPYRANSSTHPVAENRIRCWGNAVLMKGDCRMLGDYFADGSLDFIFYDLYDHRWSTDVFIISVLSIYLPKLKPDGLLIGRDFDQPDVHWALAQMGLPGPEPCRIQGRASTRLKYVRPLPGMGIRACQPN